MNWHKKQIMNYKLIAASIKKSILSRKKLNLIAAYLIAASSASAQVPSYVPTNGLLGWWPFNGNANDESGNGNNGTVLGPILTVDRFGNNNSAYSFNSNKIDVGGNNNLNISNTGISVSAWVFETSGSNLWHILGKRNQCGNFQYQLGSNIAPWGISWGGITPGETSIINSGLFISSNQWSNIIGSFDGNSWKLYINSILVDSLIAPITDAINTNLVFGTSGACQPFIGKIDDIGIWNRALTQQEITNLYNAQTCIGNISADGPTTFCAGNFVNLKSDVVGGTYQWRRNGINITTNGTSKTFKATLTGSYTCVATCNGTALTSNAIAVTSKTNASASVSATGATSFCSGDSIILNCTNLGSNYSVQWYRTNISMENATNYSTVVKQPGTYKVVTRNLTNGCSRISGSAITTSVNCRIAGDITSGTTTEETTTNAARLIDNELSQGVHIYPNPNTGSFNFTYDGEETGDALLQVINNMGQSIYQSRLTIPEGGFTQDLQLGDNITKGIYIVRLLINNSYHDSKVMVK